MPCKTMGFLFTIPFITICSHSTMSRHYQQAHGFTFNSGIKTTTLNGDPRNRMLHARLAVRPRGLGKLEGPPRDGNSKPKTGFNPLSHKTPRSLESVFLFFLKTDSQDHLSPLTAKERKCCPCHFTSGGEAMHVGRTWREKKKSHLPSPTAYQHPKP